MAHHRALVMVRQRAILPTGSLFSTDSTTTGSSTSTDTGTSSATSSSGTSSGISSTSSTLSATSLSTSSASHTSTDTNTNASTTGTSSSTTSTISSITTTNSNPTTTTSPLTATTVPSPGIVTITSTQLNSNIPTITSASSSSASTSQGFFQNKAAVAGVFTVVGLIGAVILIVLIINCIRRHRAQEFDREIAEAAAEAAAVRAPAFLDDENENYGPGYNGASPYGKYSDVSHGTYSQPPMSEAYNMRQMGPGPGDIYETSIYTVGAGAGAAGIGVARARSRRDGAFAAGLQEGTSPYPAFAGPQYNDMYNNSPTPPPDFRSTGSPDLDADPTVLENTGAAVHRGFSQQTHTSRNRSVNGFSADGHSMSHVPLGLQPRVQRNPSVAQGPVPAVVEDPSSSDLLPNPFSAATETHDIPEDLDESEEEEEQPRPVLRVANE